MCGTDQRAAAALATDRQQRGHGADAPRPPCVRIDVPTFWINEDEATHRADVMRHQLALALARGACATRVPAVTKRQASDALSGGLLFRNGTATSSRGTWRFADRQTKLRTGPLEAAIMLSHVRAVLVARALAPGATSWLVLEDHVALVGQPEPRGPIGSSRDARLSSQLFGPRRRLKSARQSPQSCPPGAPVSLGTLATALTATEKGWSAALLMVHAPDARAFGQMVAAWWRAGSPRALRATSMFARFKAGHLCEAVMTSAGAYLLSARGARTLDAMWPAALAPGTPAGFRVQVDRACFRPSVTRRDCAQPTDLPVPRDGISPPEWIADHCWLNHEFHGPLLNLAQARRAARDGPFAAQLIAARSAGAIAGSDWRLLIATPPLVTDLTSSTHGQRYAQHAMSRNRTREWWRLEDRWNVLVESSAAMRIPPAWL
jgi:hypothetical protein